MKFSNNGNNDIVTTVFKKIVQFSLVVMPVTHL